MIVAAACRDDGNTAAPACMALKKAELAAVPFLEGDRCRLGLCSSGWPAIQKKTGRRRVESHGAGVSDHPSS